MQFQLRVSFVKGMYWLACLYSYPTFKLQDLDFYIFILFTVNEFWLSAYYSRQSTYRTKSILTLGARAAEGRQTTKIINWSILHSDKCYKENNKGKGIVDDNAGVLFYMLEGSE